MDKTLKYSGYFILDLPEPFAQKINKIRRDFDPLTSKLPTEITVAGSSGIGPLSPGQSLNRIVDEVGRVIEDIKPFTFSFKGVNRFPGTKIFYLEPLNREPFDRFHNTLKGLNLDYMDNPFPYNPHCTLQASPGRAESMEEFEGIDYPLSEIRVDTLSLFVFRQEPWYAQTIYSWKLED